MGQVVIAPTLAKAAENDRLKNTETIEFIELQWWHDRWKALQLRSELGLDGEARRDEQTISFLENAEPADVLNELAELRLADDTTGADRLVWIIGRQLSGNSLVDVARTLRRASMTKDADRLLRPVAIERSTRDVVEILLALQRAARSQKPMLEPGVSVPLDELGAESRAQHGARKDPESLLAQCGKLRSVDSVSKLLTALSEIDRTHECQTIVQSIVENRTTADIRNIIETLLGSGNEVLASELDSAHKTSQENANGKVSRNIKHIYRSLAKKNS